MMRLNAILKNYARDRAGAALIYFTLVFSLILGLVAIASDFAMVYSVQNRLQSTADSAALAGASQMGNHTNIRTEATLYAKDNIPDNNGTSIIKNSDILIGNWDGSVFTNGGLPENAVEVTTRRSSANSNSLPAIFGKIMGTDSFNLSATAVAIAIPGVDQCFTEGLVAAGIVEMGSANTLSGVCMHGEQGAKVGSSNDFTNAGLSMPNLNDLDQGQQNEGIEQALAERSLPPTDALNIDSILAGYENGTSPLPAFLDGTIIEINKLPKNRVPGALYIVEEDVDLKGTGQGGGDPITNFGVYSKKKVVVTSNSNISNLLLLSDENVEIASNVNLGDPNFCSTGNGSIFIAAKDEVKFGSNNTFTGVQVLAGNYLDMGSNLENVAGLAAQSGGDIKMGSAVESGCSNQDYVLYFGSSGIVLKLVN